MTAQQITQVTGSQTQTAGYPKAGTSQTAKTVFPMSSRQLQKSGIPGRRIP